MDLPFVSGMNATVLSKSSCICISKRNSFTYKSSLVSMRKEVNFYKLLSLDSMNVGVDEIKRAYRSMVLRYHPDVCPPSKKEESTKMFVELQKAYETLSDPIMRRRYDCQLGLVDFVDADEANEEERSCKFPKEVWINQLNGLDVRSEMRMARNK